MARLSLALLFTLASSLSSTLAAPTALGLNLLERDDGDAPQAVTIQSGRDGKCLSLAQGDSTPVGDGVQVVSMDCDTASGWIINKGSGSVLLAADEGFALDAGDMVDHGGLKIWTSYPGLTQQTWYYTDDDRIAITGGTQCIDEGDNGPQTYPCGPGNENQVWTTEVIDYCD